MTEKSFYSESFLKGQYSTSFEIVKKLHQEQSKWQKIEVYETKAIGRLLVLDGKTMVSDHDEFIYHESLVHVPYMVSREAKNVLVIGGGDGGIVRELCKHPSLEKIDLVEIDERVIEVSREFFPHCTSALTDPRVTIHATDGIEYIKAQKNAYDIIIIDSTDPEDFASGLFTDEFYSHVNSALTSQGIMVAQTENPLLDAFGIGAIYDNLRKAFPSVESYYAPILIYPGVYWTFAFASKKWGGTDIDPSKKEAMVKLQKNLRWYNLNWHFGTFQISNFHKKMTGIEL